MKFIATVVILALAVSTQASLLPVAHNAGLHYGGSLYNGWNSLNDISYRSPLTYTARSTPITHAVVPILHAVAPIVQAVAPIVQAVAPIVHAAPLAYAAHHDIVREAPHIIESLPIGPVVVGEGKYVAANRGAIHTAPLHGHIESVSSINLEAAPGTL